MRTNIFSRGSVIGDQTIQSEQTLIHPSRAAALMAGVYSVVGIVYIMLSSKFASQRSTSTLELYQIELLKGGGYVLVTGVLLFLFAFWSFRRISVKEKEIRHQQRVFLASEKRSAAGLFASSIAHDINNILHVNRIAIERIKTQQLPEGAVNNLLRLEQVQEKLDRLVHELSLASGEHLTDGIEQIDLADNLDQAISLARLHGKVKFCTLEASIPGSLKFFGDASLFHRMIINLIINAADATENRGSISVRVREDGGEVVIEVHDNGTGIPKELRPRILDPFFSTKSDGSGLGLLSVKLCAEVHQGLLEIDDSELGGICFRLRLPKTR